MTVQCIRSGIFVFKGSAEKITIVSCQVVCVWVWRGGAGGGDLQL